MAGKKPTGGKLTLVKAGVKATKPKAPARPVKKAPAKRALTPAAAKAHAKGRAPRVAEGRPTLYKPEHVRTAFQFCLMGATDKKLAELFEVTESTINLWKVEHPEFSESIWSGREKADAVIAESLYHRAMGYSHEEDDIRTVALGANQGSEIVITRTTKHYPPDTAAASLWLRNRQQKLWREKSEVEHGGRLTLEQLPDAEIDSRLNEAIKRMGK